MHLPPTVLVVNPASPGEPKIINVADLAEDHVLWPGQDSFVDPRVKIASVEESYVAAMLRMMADRYSMSVEDYAGLPEDARRAHLADWVVGLGAEPLSQPEQDVRVAAVGLVERCMSMHHDMILDRYRELPATERLLHIGEAASKLQGDLARKSAETTVKADLRIAKGARGLWFVMRGTERIGAGHPAEADAVAAMAIVKA